MDISKSKAKSWTPARARQKHGHQKEQGKSMDNRKSKAIMDNSKSKPNAWSLVKTQKAKARSPARARQRRRH
jgi:hypothetical protein